MAYSDEKKDYGVVAGYVSLWDAEQRSEESPLTYGYVTLLVKELENLPTKTDEEGREVISLKISVWKNKRKRSDKSPEYTGKLQENKPKEEVEVFKQEDTKPKPRGGSGKFS